jgi:hypothetical protein
VAVTSHVVVEADDLVVAVAEVILFAFVVVEVVDPFDADADFEVNAHLFPFLCGTAFAGADSL